MPARATHPGLRPALGAMTALAGALGACSWTEGPLRRHLVLGIGVVDTAIAVPPACGPTPSRADHCRAAGLLLGSGPVHTGLLLGLAERTTLEAPPDLGACLHASRDASGTLVLSITAIPSLPPPQEPPPCAPSPP